MELITKDRNTDTKQAKSDTGIYGTVVRGDGRVVKVYIPSKEEDEEDE